MKFLMKSNFNHQSLSSTHLWKLTSEAVLNTSLKKYTMISKPVFEKNMEKLRGLFEISDVSFPRVEKMSEKACYRVQRANIMGKVAKRNIK